MWTQYRHSYVRLFYDHKFETRLEEKQTQMLKEVEQKHGQNYAFTASLPPPNHPPPPLLLPYQRALPVPINPKRLPSCFTSPFMIDFMDDSLSSNNKFISRLSSSLVDDLMTITDSVFTRFYCRQAATRSLKKIVQQGSKISAAAWIYYVLLLPQWLN